MDININGENLNHLCLADDIMLISDNLKKAETLLVRLTSASFKVELKIDTNKIQFITNPVSIRNSLEDKKKLFRS